MKKLIILILTFALVLSLTACGKKESNNTPSDTENTNNETITATDVNIDGMDLEFTDKDLSADYNSPKEMTEDIVEITSAGDYLISGKHKQIIVKADKSDKLKIVLNNAELTSENGPAIYIEQADKVFITIPENSESTLTDSAEYSEDYGNADGVIFSRADLTINGSGKLNINSKCKCGIVSKDDLVVCDTSLNIESIGTALEGKDCLKIKNAVVTVNSSGDGLKSNNTEDTNRGFVYIHSGEYNITSMNDGIQAETALIIDNGNFNITSGGGSAVSSSNTNSGWGNWQSGFKGQFGGYGTQTESTDDTESAKALKATAIIKISGGEFNIDSSDDSLHSNSDLEISGGNFTVTSGDDGIHADDDLIISGGNITVNKSYEGIEATVITVSGGNIDITASDDGFNAAGGNDSSALGGRPGQNPFESDSSAIITITNGNILINSAGDGIDSNGNLTINGGTIFVNGPENDGNGALDYGGEARINGGKVAITGTSGMAQGFSSNSVQASFMYNLITVYSANTKISLSDGEKELISFTSVKKFNSIIISLPELNVDTTYTLTIGENSEEITLNSVSTTIGSGGMGGHGNMGGFGGMKDRPDMGGGRFR